MLGIGVGHASDVVGAGLRYHRPLQKMMSYLDDLDAASPPVPPDERCLASLGPKALILDGSRSAGTHPYFVSPEHTWIARQALGPGKLLAPEQMVVIETDPRRARAIARTNIGWYLHAPNYTNNLLRLGFEEADFDNGGSDRLVDAIVAWGDPHTIIMRVHDHFAAGADHVCIQVLTDDPREIPMEGWRSIAAAAREVGAFEWVPPANSASDTGGPSTGTTSSSVQELGGRVPNW